MEHNLVPWLKLLYEEGFVKSPLGCRCSYRYCTKPRRFNGNSSWYIKYFEYVLCITAYACMYVWCLNTMHGFKGGGREKETLEMPLGVLAEQFSIRIAESRLVAGSFPWLMTASSFSLLWEGFCVCVCVFGIVFGRVFLLLFLQHVLISFAFPVSRHNSWRVSTHWLCWRPRFQCKLWSAKRLVLSLFLVLIIWLLARQARCYIVLQLWL